MKKILSTLICLLLCVSSMFAAHTITIKAYAVNKDGSTPVGGTVTLKVTKSRGTNNGDKEGTTKTTDETGNIISVTAKGYDGVKLGPVVIGAYNPFVDLTVSVTTDGYFVEGIYLEKTGGVLEGAGVTGFSIEGNKNETRTYKVVFDKRNSDLPEEITYTNHSTLKFYTGTEADQSTSAFYKEKTKIDLSSTFASDGQPLFDVLYMFGVTVSKDGKVINEPKLGAPKVACNASTPCYVYKKNGTKYVFDSEVDATQARFDHGTNMNEKKLYFTGYCPFANIGAQTSDEGWMYFTGSRNAKLDIYLDNCEILGKYRSGDGSANFSKFPTNYVNFTVSTLTQELSGVSSIFVFEGMDNNGYNPTIHIKGTNHLKGQFGYITELLAFGNPLDELGVGRKQNIVTYSAPITLKTLQGKVNLVMDDLWPQGAASRITNGFLRLDAYKYTQSGNTAEKCPSIDLGTESGKLTINGGQYCLRNNASLDGNYTSNLAVCYRKYVEASIVTLYGFGNDMTEAPVIINSGTFTMYPNMFGKVGEQYYLDDNFMDLRLPYGAGSSKINGGTFNEIANVVLCSNVTSSGASPINSHKEWLCLQDVVVTDDLTDANPVTSITLPDYMLTWGIADVAQDLTADGAMTALEEGEAYGGQSLNAYKKDDKTIVRLLLPGDALCENGCEGCVKREEAIYRNWAFAIPKVTMSGALAGEIGGEIEIETQSGGENTVSVIVNQLMYVDMLGLENMTISSIDSETSIQVKNKTQPRGQIINSGEYKISEHLNLLKVVEADQWYCFTAPFNINTVSVLEVWEDKVSQQETKALAEEMQFAANSDFWIGIRSYLLPNGNRYGSALTFEAMVSDKERKAKLIPLIHYNGENLMTANYYLYELEQEEFGTSGTRENLAIKWKPVKRDNASDPLMYQGKTYAIQFPWCPMCNDLDSRDYYDYWSKKFIRFYGKGDQTLSGSNEHNSILATTPNPNHATLVGNYTLKDMNLDANEGYVHNTTNDYFELNTSDYVVKPTEGYMLYNSSTSRMPERISRSGKMIYSDNTTTDTEGVPTISDRTSLMLFDAMDGVEILSLSEQVVLVYNLQGNLIFRQQMTAGEQIYVATGSGIFVVRGESETIKVMVD